jgi:hypothetical protein
MEPDLTASTKQRPCTELETFVDFWKHLFTDSLSYPVAFCTAVQIGVGRLDNDIIRDTFGQGFSKLYQELSNEIPPLITTLACTLQIHFATSVYYASHCTPQLTGEVPPSDD